MPYVGAGVPVGVRGSALGVTPASPWQSGAAAAVGVSIDAQIVTPLGPSDTAPPTPTITAGPTKTRISRIAGQDAFTFDWQSSEDFSHYQVRVVADPADTYVMGAQLELDENPAAGGLASTTYTSTITDDEVVAASPGDGPKLLKVFCQDLAGNWSA